MLMYVFIIYVEIYMYIINKSLKLFCIELNYYLYFVLKILIKYIKYKKFVKLKLKMIILMKNKSNFSVSLR